MKTFIDKTSAYQRKHESSPRQRYTRLSRILDSLAFSIPPEIEQRFEKVRAKVRAKVRNFQDFSPSPLTGPFSGLTRAELAMSRTCETDWF